MEIKAEIIQAFLDGQKNVHTQNLVITTGTLPSPFRTTKEELGERNEPYQIGPWGRHGHPDPPGFVSALELLREKQTRELKRKLSETDSESTPSSTNSSPVLRRSERLAKKEKNFM